MRRILGAFLVGGALVLAPLPASGGDLQLTFKDGRVTLKAEGMTIKQILAEWAKLGGTKIVNAEKLVGGPLTLELVDMPEKAALDVLLRAAAGYLAAPRPAGVEGASSFDRIVVLATSSGPLGPPPRTPGRATTFAPPPPPVMPQVIDPTEQGGVVVEQVVDDENSPNPPGVPVFNPNVEPVNPNDPDSFTPGFPPGAPAQAQPVPLGQSPIRPYASPNDPNAPPPGPVNQPPSGFPGTGAVTSPTPGTIPIPQPQPRPPQ